MAPRTHRLWWRQVRRHRFHVVRAVDRWGCKPVVDRVFSLEETPQALEHMAAGAHLGKICIKID